MNLHFFELIFYVLLNDDQICQRAFEADVLHFSARMDICLFRRWWSGPLRVTTHKHIIHSQHDTLTERSSCLDMLVISVTSHRGQHIQRLEQKQIFPAFWLLGCSSLFSHYAPLSAVEVRMFKQIVDLSFFLIMSSLPKKRGANVPMNPMQ